MVSEFHITGVMSTILRLSLALAKANIAGSSVRAIAPGASAGTRSYDLDGLTDYPNKQDKGSTIQA
jgi:hypothetical protein